MTCNERMCFQKRPYLTELQAKGVAERIWAQRAVRLFTYKCPYCLRWHLTKKPRRGWNAFPPPDYGVYEIRDRKGTVQQVEVVNLGWSGRPYVRVNNHTIGRVDRMAGAGYEWRISATADTKSGESQS